jgi:putative hemolysin
MSLTLGVTLIILCVLMQGFFSGSEMALVSANRVRLQARAQEGNLGASRALELLASEETLLGTCLIGTNLCVVTGSTLATAVVIHLELAEGYAALAFLPVALLFGEAVPKTVYQYHANVIAPAISRPLQMFQRFFSPVLWGVAAWAKILRTWTDRAQVDGVSREDIVELIEEGSQGIDPEDHQLIQRVFAMSETAVEDCMTPLVDVDAVSVETTVDEVTQMMIQSGHSRYPVYEERIDNLVGVVDCRDLLLVDPKTTVNAVMVAVKFVPETKKADLLLKELRGSDEHLVAVVDEYGGSVGIVTLEDLLEELVGEIRDERDRVQPMIRRIGHNEWRIPARAEVDALCELLDQPLPHGDYETVAGLLLSHLGRIPKSGEIVRVGNLKFIIERASDRAIEQIRLRREDPYR